MCLISQRSELNLWDSICLVRLLVIFLQVDPGQVIILQLNRNKSCSVVVNVKACTNVQIGTNQTITPQFNNQAADPISRHILPTTLIVLTDIRDIVIILEDLRVVCENIVLKQNYLTVIVGPPKFVILCSSFAIQAPCMPLLITVIKNTVHVKCTCVFISYTSGFYIFLNIQNV